MRPTNPARVYLDSNTLITGILKRPGYELVEEILVLANARKVQLLISALTYVEVRAEGRGKSVNPDDDRIILAVLDSPAFTQIEFFRGLAVRARRYAQTMSLRNYDAIHLASAVEGKADVLMTWDDDFPRGQDVHGVWVDEPYELGDPALFSRTTGP